MKTFTHGFSARVILLSLAALLSLTNGYAQFATWTDHQSPRQTMNLHVVAGSNSPVCTGSALNLYETGGQATSWSWTGPNGFTSTLQNPTIPSAGSINQGVYTVTASDGVNTASASVNVIVSSDVIVQTYCPTDITACADQFLNGSFGTYVNWTLPDFELNCVTGSTGGNSELFVMSFDLPESQTQANCWTYNKVQRIGTGGGRLRLWQSNGTGDPYFTTPTFYFDGPTNGSLSIYAKNGETFNVNIYLIDINNNISGIMSSFTVTGNGSINLYPFVVTPDFSGIYSMKVVFTGNGSNSSYVDLFKLDAMIFGDGCNGDVNFSVTGPVPGFFTPGSYTQTYTAKYIPSSGSSFTSVCSFVVNVEGTTAQLGDIVPASCEQQNGSITVNAASSSSSPSFEYSLNSGAWTSFGGGSSVTIGGLNDGTYTINVRDISHAGDCEIYSPLSATVTRIPKPVVTLDPAGPFCEDDEAYQLVYSPAGGTFSGTGVSSTGLFDPGVAGAGSHIIIYTYTGDYDCVVSAEITIIVYPVPEVTLTDAGPFCFDAEPYQLIGTPSGGVFTGTGVSSTGLFSPSVSGAGTFEITYTYTTENNCSASDQISVTVNPELVATISIFSNISCYGYTDGSIDLSVSGGTAPYTYSWSNGATTEDLANLAAGAYTVTVTDALNCTTTQSITLTQPEVLNATAVISGDECGVEPSGAINITVTGGTSPYTFSWTGPDGFTSTSEDISGLDEGFYHLTITDANDCSYSDSYEVVESEDLMPPVAPVLSDVTAECSVTVTAPVAQDNCSGEVTGTTTDPLTYTQQGSYEIHWTFTDANNNSSYATQNVIVDDVTPPVQPVLSDATGECSVTVTAPVTTDNCAGTITGTTTDPLTYNFAGYYTITWTFDDGNGNSVTATQNVTVTDTGIPQITTVDESRDLGCNPTVTAPSFNGNDNCDGPFTPTVQTSGPIATGCAYVQTWTATHTDSNGNVAIPVSITYTWTVDTENPVLTVPTTGLALGCNPIALPTVASVVAASSATDNCGTPTITAVAGTITGDCQKSQTFTVTATDGCGNTDVKDVTYTWSDDSVAPTLTVPTTGLALGCNPTTLPTVSSVVAASSATDNCGTPTITAVAGTITGDCQKSQTFTVTATDGCGNTDVKDVTYTWSDDSVAPTLTVPTTGLALGCNPTALPTISSVVAASSATDNCGTPTITAVAGTITGDCQKSQTFTVTATDGCGNTDVKDVIYTWNDDSVAPTLTVPTTGLALGCNPTTLPTVVSVVAASSATDNCGTPTIMAVAGTITGDCQKSQTFTVTATDGCGNTDVKDVTYTWSDDTVAPTLTVPTTGLALGCNPIALPTVSSVVAASSATDNCGTPTITAVAGTITGDCQKSQTFTVTATDGCGNTDVKDVTYTWSDDTVAPTLTVPTTGLALGCNPIALPTVSSVVAASSATDNCGTPTITAVAGTITGDCQKSQTFTVTATDGCGNTDVKDVTYTWTVDTELPVISTTATSGDLGCNPVVEAPVFTGLDNCEGVFTPVVTTTGVIIDGCAYSQTWTANYTDACENEAAEVSITYTWTVDTELPVISTTATSGDLGCNPEVVAPVFTGLDNCEGVFTPVVTTTGVIIDGCAYSQTWTANYTDACENVAAEVSITYTWTVDTELPVISTTATSGDLGCNPVVEAPVFTGLDNCEGVFTPVVTTTGVIIDGCAYSQTWTANYTDACENEAAEVSITYTWTVDNELPVISTTATSGDLGCNPVVEAPVFTGLDNCEGVFTPVVTTTGVIIDGCAYSQTWTANYTDACENEAAEISITYTWTVDTELPVISTTATSGDLGCNPVVEAPVFTGLDNCEGVFTPVVTTTGVIIDGCAYSQTWTANYTDACENEAAEVSITYTWTVDTELPVISTTATSGDLGCNPEVVAPVFTGLDNCEGVFTPVVTTTGVIIDGCAYSQTWTANYTDACENEAAEVSITYTWTVDNELPVISTTATSGDLGCNPVVVAPVFTGLDNCEGVFTPVVTTTGVIIDGCAYSQTWTANYTDACENEAAEISITYTWTIDTELPVISTTATSGDLGCNPEVVAPVFTGLDNCEGVFTPVVTTTGVIIDGCAYSQTWTANYTDACENEAAEVSITYTWTVDTELPVISTTATSGDLGCNPVVEAPVFTGLDNCEGVFTPVVTTTGVIIDGCAYSQTWTANYTDACENEAAEVSITYTWTVDTELPVISTTATSGDLGCNPEVVAPVFTGLDNCEGVFTPVVTTTGVIIDGCAYSQTWTANYTDACENEAAEVSITYTWTVDTELPVISTTATSGDLGCNPEVVAPVFTGLDNCEGVFTPVVTTTGVIIDGCAYSQTWTANYTDACENEAAEVSITYTWTVDTELPVISTTATSGDLGCNPEVVAPVFTGLDNCEGVFTPVVTTTGVIIDGCAYSQTWTANYTDACENEAAEVSITYTWTVDTELPVISTTATSGDLGCNPVVEAPVFTGLDNCEGVFTPVVTTTGVIIDGCAYSQTWTANYTDACENEAAEVSITYTWTVDTELPVISTTATSGDLGCNPEVVAPVFTGLDNCEGVFTPVVTTTGVIIDGCAYSQTWTANYTDACENEAAEISITYTWTVDTELPVISTTATSGDLGCNPEVVAPVFTGLDNCEGVFTPVVTTTGVIIDGCAYSQTWTANYTDACENEAAEVSITYTWTVDNELPVISTTATSGDLGCNPVVEAPVFTGLDNCEGVFTPVVTTTGVIIDGCAYSQTWTANYTDACENEAAEVSITYTWTVDNELPVISTTATSGDLGCNPVVEAPVFTGLDNCEGVFTPVVTTTGVIIDGCAYSQAWTANYTDACENEAAEVSITYTWTVDTELPVISTTATSGDLGCNPVVEAPVFTGLDNCEGVFTPVVTTTGVIIDGCAYSQTWTANYTDACENEAAEVSITYTWTVDTELPVISTTATSGDLGCNPEVVAPVFTGLDNCEGVFTPVVTTTGVIIDGCAYSQTWTANYTDACENEAAEISITYTWTVDTELPVISTTATSGDLGCNPEVVAPVFTGLDNCEGVFTPVVTTTGVIIDGCAYSQTWTANYTDACENEAAEVSITYTWTVDNELPVISTTATSGDLGCNPVVEAPVFTGLDNCEGVFTPVVTTTGVIIDGCAYSQAWTANYTDACENEAAEVSITYTWTVDTELPVISTTATSGDLGCNPVVEAPVFTGLDNCEGVFTPVVTTTGVIIDGCAYSQTWTANYTDACENEAAEVSITYTWTVDTEAPIFTALPENITVNCDGAGNPGELTNWLNSPVAEDACGEVTITNNFAGLSDLCGATGTATVTWTATDNCGNSATVTATFTIVDTEAPEIICPQNIVVDTEPGMCGAWIEVPVPAASDACGEVTLVNNITGTANATGSYPLGVTTVTWTASDECGNVSTCSITIIVNDNEDPHIICPQHITVNADPGVCEAYVTVPQPIVSDNCEIRTITNTYTHTDDASAVYPVGTTVVWWTVVDMSGNSSSCFMNVTVVDNEAPVIECPEDIATAADPGVCEAYVSVPQPVVSDNCGIVSVVNSFNGTDDASGNYPAGTTIVTWTVTDLSGFTAECSMTVTVSDEELPAIECPEDIAVNTDPGVCEASVTVPQPVVSDNCGIASVVNSFNGTNDASGIYPEGTTTITWTVVDVNGNSAECIMTVTVTDDEMPVIECPEDIAVNTDPGVCEAYVSVSQPVVSDNCGIESIVNSFNGTDDASGIYPAGVTTVVWTVTDIHGLTSTCEMSVTVTDTEAPVIECPDDIQAVAGEDCNALVEIPQPVVSDNCGIEQIVSDPEFTGSLLLPVGVHSITWTVTDIHGNQASCQMKVTVIAGPLANDDFATTEMNIPVSVPVLENDTDCDNNIDPSTVTVITNPGHGFTMVDTQNGNILYTPEAGFHGTDTFIYRVCDVTGLCDEATVTITIEGFDPIYLVAVNDLDTTLMNTPRVIINMANDIVPEGITAGIEILVQPQHGSLMLHSDYTVTYTPDMDYTGTDEFTYILYDLNGVATSDTATSVIVIVPDDERAEIVIYNAITPNGDGRNDKWIIDGIEEYADNEVLIFNRWGDQVRYFENYNNTSVVWDGSNAKGKDLPDGTYYYIVKLRSVSEIYTGWVIIHGR